MYFECFRYSLHRLDLVHHALTDLPAKRWPAVSVRRSLNVSRCRDLTGALRCGIPVSVPLLFRSRCFSPDLRLAGRVSKRHSGAGGHGDSKVHTYLERLFHSGAFVD